MPRQRRDGEAQWDNGAERGRERTGRMAEKDGPAGRARRAPGKQRRKKNGRQLHTLLYIFLPAGIYLLRSCVYISAKGRFRVRAAA